MVGSTSGSSSVTLDAADAVDELDETVEVDQRDVVDLGVEGVGERVAHLLEGGLALAGRLLQVEVERVDALRVGLARARWGR